MYTFAPAASGTQVVAGDPASSRIVYGIVIGLLAIGVVLVAIGIWVIRQTRIDPELLAPLERMNDRRWRRLDPTRRRRILDAARPEGAEPVQRRPSDPEVDSDFERHEPPVPSFDDLIDAESLDAAGPAGSAAGAATVRLPTGADQGADEGADEGADRADDASDAGPHDTSDAVDAAGAADVASTVDAVGAADVAGTVDAGDAVDAAGTVDAGDTGAAPDAVDVGDPGAAPDAVDAAGTIDAGDAVDAAGTVDAAGEPSDGPDAPAADEPEVFAGDRASEPAAADDDR